MSLIGKKIEFFDPNDKLIKKGQIIEKFRGTTQVVDNIAVPANGLKGYIKAGIMVYKSVDFYIIKTIDDSLCHIRCDYVYNILDDNEKEVKNELNR